MNMEEVRIMVNAKIFAQQLNRSGVKAHVIDRYYPVAQQVIIKWDRPEGAISASHRLAKAGIFAEAVPLSVKEEGDRCTGLHFSLVGVTRLDISEDDLKILAMVVANLLLGYFDVDMAKKRVLDISSHLNSVKNLEY